MPSIKSINNYTSDTNFIQGERGAKKKCVNVIKYSNNSWRIQISKCSSKYPD